MPFSRGFRGAVRGGLEPSLSIGSVARGGLFLFIASMIASILGTLYLIMLSVVGGPDVVGTAGVVLGLSSLVTGVFYLGLPTGTLRFMGREFGHGNTRGLNMYFWSSLFLTLIFCVVSALVIWIMPFSALLFVGFTSDMLFFTGLLLLLAFSVVISHLLTSVIKTEYIAASNAIASVAKFGLGLYLVYSGFGWIGVILGVLLGGLVQAVLLLFFALRELKRLGGIDIRFSLKASGECLKAGSASWLPSVLGLLGQQLGLLLVFGSRGGIETGTFFIAQQVFLIFFLLPGSFMSILFPILSGLAGGGKELARKALRLCLAIACPLTTFVMLYSGFVLSILGGAYIQAAPTLSLLAISMIPLTVISAVSNVVYAIGSYGKVIGLSLSMDAPRIALYFMLVPMYGGLGAALSYLIGSLTGFVATMYVSRRIAFGFLTRKIAVAVAFPFGVALPLFLAGLNWLVGGIIIFLTSVFYYGRSGVVERSEVAEIARAFASEKTVAKTGERLGWILRIIYGE